MVKDCDPNTLLKLERQRFADFQRAASEWSWETDEQHRFTYMSPNVREITGIDPEWHYGKTREDLGFREDMDERAWLAFQDLLAQHKPFTNLTYARRGPDTVTWVQTSGVPFYENGKFRGYRGSGRVVTKEIETAKLADRLTNAIENMGNYFSLWDKNDRLIFCNNLFRQLNVRIPEQSGIGVTFSDYMRAAFNLPPFTADPEATEAIVADRIRRHKHPGPPFEFTRSDGVTALIVEHKLPDGMTATMSTDITRQKEIEKDRAVKAEIVETAFRTIPDGIIVLGPDTNPVTWNDYLFTLFDIEDLKTTDPDELRVSLLSVISHKISTGMPEAGQTDVSAMLLDPQQSSHIEFRLDMNKWVEYRGSPMAGGGYLMIFHDFTEQRELDRMKSQFISTVSHELRTPLTSILGSLGLVKGGAGGEIPAPARDILDIGINNGERLLNLINDILDLEKISHDEFELELEDLALDEVIESSVNANLGFADRYQVGLYVDRGAGGFTVSGDRLRLMQVMDNLLSNAVKFSKPNDEVEIKIAARKDMVRVSVTDRGPGVPKKFQKTIFDRFVQVDSSDTRSIAGTGLGLCICQEIITGHGGQISLHSTAAVGSTFYFELPMIKRSAG
ncbi:MAG: PAS-domain containing protein [Rhodospirillales bacterium]|nr:PAS-domain containing protein [Rhodospirillales bacterium]